MKACFLCTVQALLMLNLVSCTKTVKSLSLLSIKLSEKFKLTTSALKISLSVIGPFRSMNLCKNFDITYFKIYVILFCNMLNFKVGKILSTLNDDYKVKICLLCLLPNDLLSIIYS